MVVRRGPGLIGTVARTAVVAGTATAVSGTMISHQQGKQAEAAEAQAAQQQAYDNQAEMEAMRQQMAAMQAAQVQAAAPAGTDVVAQLQQLAQLKSAGALTDEEFQVAKGKLLGTA